MQVKKQQLELDMEQWISSKLGKEYINAICFHLSYLFNLYAEYILQNAGLDEAQAGITTARRNINKLRRHTYGRKQRGTKEPLDEVKEESEKIGLKLNIQIINIIASGPIISKQIDGENVETAADFIFLGSKITVDNDWSHEIKRGLLLGRKVMTNLDSILKSKDITSAEEGLSSQSYSFSSSHLQMWDLDH